MRRALTLLLLPLIAAACRRQAVGAETGAATSQQAVMQFLNAAQSQDLQAMSAVWGNEESPVRDRVGRQELERRLMIMTCHLRHDNSRIGPPAAGEAGRTLFAVELTQGDKKASPQFKTVRNARSGRWFVEEFDMVAVASFCTGAQPRPAPPSAARTR